MKKYILSIILFIYSNCVALATDYITFSKWEADLITYIKDGEEFYSALYKGVEYPLTWDEYNDLLSGKDITKEKPSNN